MPDYPFTPEQRAQIEYIRFLARGYNADRNIRPVDTQPTASVLKDTTFVTVNADPGTDDRHVGKAQQAVLGVVST